MTLKKKLFLKFGLIWGKFWPLCNLRRNLCMFLDIIELKIEEEKI